MRTTISTERRMGLQFTEIEEVVMESELRIYDAEGVRVHVDDEIEMIVVADRMQRFGRVLEISEDCVVIGWNDSQTRGEMDAITFEDYCRILVSVGGESVPVPAGSIAGMTASHELDEIFSFAVGDGATAIGWSDRYAGTIIEAGPKRVLWQEDKATLLNRDELTVTPGGFAAHWEGVQRYGYERDENGRTCVYSLRKNGRWIEKGAPLHSTARIVPGRCKHHDYNF